MGAFSSQTKKNLLSNQQFDQMLGLGRTFQILIKKLISELTWKPQDESFDAFDRIISTSGLL
jgi:hypothetical protein